MNINKAIIVGNITRKPELRSLPNGTSVCSFSVATNHTYTSNGQKREEAEFHNIVCFGKTADNVSRYMDKGNQIYVEGRIKTRMWEKDGHKNYRTEIVADQVQFGARPANRTQPAAEVAPSDDYMGDVPPAEASQQDDIDVSQIPF